MLINQKKFMRAVDEFRKNLTREIINPGKKYLGDGDKPRKKITS